MVLATQKEDNTIPPVSNNHTPPITLEIKKIKISTTHKKAVSFDSIDAVEPQNKQSDSIFSPQKDHAETLSDNFKILKTRKLY